MSPPHEVLDLIDRFRRNLNACRSGPYNETQVRREFIAPFFNSIFSETSRRPAPLLTRVCLLKR